MANTPLNIENFHPLEVVSRYRDPQLQVGEKYTFLFIWDQMFSNIDVSTLQVSEHIILWNFLIITVYFFIWHPLQVIFIHYKMRIATAIRGL